MAINMSKPVKTIFDDRVEWRLHGDLHREDGPARIRNGSTAWFQFGLRHRESEPAIELDSGHKEWWFRGKRHREDGPAVSRADGSQEWWFGDVQYSEEEWLVQIIKSWKQQ